MKRGCLVAAGLGLLLAIPLALFVVPRWSDIPPVDDSDLVLPERNIDPAQNPFPEIRSFELSADAKEPAKRAWLMIRGDEELDEAFITNLLSIEAGTLDRFDVFSRMTDWREDQEITLSSELPYLSNWIAIAKLKVLEVRRARQMNDLDEAVKSGISILRFAEGLHHAEGSLIHQLVSVTIASLGISEILKTVETGRLSPEQLKGLSRSLSGLGFSPEIFAQAYIVEYRTFEKVIDDLASGRVDIGQLAKSEENPGLPGNPPASFYFKRNKTTKLLADAYRQFIAQAPMIRSEVPDGPAAEARAMRENTGALYFSGNLVGRILFSIAVPGSQVNEAQAAMRVSLDLLRLRVAMEKYRMEKGDWPDDLESLVPEFIESIPVDLMDGQPIRYLKGKKVIYSVGDDFEDDGGVDRQSEDSLKSRSEIVIKIRTESESAP